MTLDRAAFAVWQEIGGHDAAIPLSQIAHRLRKVVGGYIPTWLTLIIDGTLDARKAEEVVHQPWDDWGVRVVLTTAPHIADRVEMLSRGRCAIVTVGDFAVQELHAYLGFVLGDNWPSMPGFVRTVLRKPLFANLYRQLVEPERVGRWSPTSEYDLFDAFWARASDEYPLDESVLVALAERFLANGDSTWSASDLSHSGANEDAIARLEWNGWLLRTRTDGRQSFTFAHARLLNWACAFALREQWRRGDITDSALNALLRALLNGTNARFGHQLGFVPMDFLWLVCKDVKIRSRTVEVIAGLEGNYVQYDALYGHLLPTLGEDIIDALVERLRASITDSYRTRMVARAIGSIQGERAVTAGLNLLGAPEPLVRRFASEIFEACPDGRALDLLWLLHNESQANPVRFLAAGETSMRPFRYEQTFAALRECCRAAPDWLTDAIGKADPSREEVSDLAYLVANIGGDTGRQLWLANKAVLFAKVPKSKSRSLAACIDAYADRDEVSWLIETLGKSTNLVSPRAFAALARLDPARAVQEIPRLSQRDLASPRGWFSTICFPSSRRRRVP